MEISLPQKFFEALPYEDEEKIQKEQRYSDKTHFEITMAINVLLYLSTCFPSDEETPELTIKENEFKRIKQILEFYKRD
ncbi:hypothetical protein DICPUDRAFT_159590 [Dictyostelium purpureum]|uniref:Uncharacterized protein n=1 Tax=Dictyostelium purpureum TaxID=5786 RepID=F1A4H3_DICPU|nr:uncharacterized protein DICPUDRAFT_159590 [Dictyostelium purpureum]EGC28902.1 hypothetical protein DICPUDRAFT_159590 [Dictyostelium purpureum]|eukprot:XP_003294567.1 hypothetical protein DICPUDRAFT_159590 [Dictyostelium purpureum]